MRSPFIEHFVDVAPAILKANFRPDSCINSTRVFIEVMRAFNVKAEPRSVMTVAVNRIYAEKLIANGGWPTRREQTDEWCAAGGWSLGIDIDGHTNADGWPGHLVAVAQDFLVDASARQFNRPTKGIPIPDVFVAPMNRRFRKGKGSIEGHDTVTGSMIFYTPRFENETFKQMPGWQFHDMNRRVAAEITNIIAERIGRKAVAV